VVIFYPPNPNPFFLTFSPPYNYSLSLSLTSPTYSLFKHPHIEIIGEEIIPQAGDIK
jgi:hypothetical protein